MRSLAALLLIGCASSEPRVCNGSESLCARALPDITLPATHNAMSNADEAWLVPNQQRSPATQLEDGIRGMLLDTYVDEGELVLCHSRCDWGREPFANFLDVVDTFLETHPDEVLVWVLQDAAGAAAIEEVLVAEGWMDRLYRHDGSWPTLEEMLDAGTPILLTAEGSADPADPDWYHRFYDLGFDTPYTYASTEDFTCDVLRGESDHALYLVNHWLAAPISNPELAAVANDAAVLGPRIDACAAQHGRPVNLVAVDHYDVGDLFEVVATLNGL